MLGLLRDFYFPKKVHSEDSDLSITYLKKANEIAQEGTEVIFCFTAISDLLFAGGDSYQEGKACYRLGNALERIGRSEYAITVITT